MIQAELGSTTLSSVMAGGSIIASLATLAVVSFNGGKITQKVADHDKQFADQSVDNKYFNDKISEHDRGLAELKGIDLATRRHEA